MKKVRESNFELLRIICMMLIISFHYVYKGNFVFESFTLNKMIVKTFFMFGEIGVNCFILITGYFQIKKTFKWRKLALLSLEVWFYYLLNYIIAIKMGVVPFSYRALFFPIILNRYWFVTVYALIYVFSPFINFIIIQMKQRLHLKFMIMCLLVWSMIPTVFGVLTNDTESQLYFNRFIWLVIVYMVGAYCRLYQSVIFSNKKNVVCMVE